ncbi:MAG TPA: type IV secretory system conjugative DNA transfer family protein [Gemmataceae bacterium]|jgi:hypothetical protein
MGQPPPNKLFELMNQHPIIPICMFAFLLIGGIWNWKKKRAAKQSGQDSQSGVTGSSKRMGGLLDQALMWWSKHDPLLIRDLLRSIAIFGASGAGKSSGSGFQIAKALAKCRQIGGLILASKPEDREFWQRIFRQAGRTRDLLVFSATAALRFNFLDFILRNGGSTRDITQAIMVIGETLESGVNRERDPFWDKQNARMIYNAVEMVQGALGRVTGPDLERFVIGAANTPEELSSEKWQNAFHSKVLERALNNASDPVREQDCRQGMDYWLKQYPRMADKTRSSILAGVMGILHVFNTGIVRELVSTTTNVSPAVMDEGKWVLVDLPISSEGTAGAFILAGWKYLTQWHILKRHATEETPISVIWADEAQKVVNSFDAPFLAECRSHRGSMVYLSQSIHAYYTKMQEGGEHEADSFLTNFYHKIFHALGDDKTAAYASSLIGRRLTTRYGGSMSPVDSVYDAMFGQMKFSGSFSQSIENILENRAFMQGLRTGGREHGYMVDGYVIRSEPFATGENYLKVAFSQK